MTERVNREPYCWRPECSNPEDHERHLDETFARFRHRLSVVGRATVKS